MAIGDKIKSLRKEKGITQEKLAEYLNITYQSVSKWENNTALPDLSFIVPLANFFGVTTDEILEFNTNKEKVLREYYEKRNELMKDGLVRENCALWREAAQKYPNDFHCLEELARALLNISQSGEFTAEEQMAAVGEGIVICNRILKDCKDHEICSDILQTLTCLYVNSGNEEMAVKTAMKATDICVSKQVLLETAYNWDNPQKGVLKCQNALQYLDMFVLDIMYQNRNRQEQIQALETLLVILQALFYDGNYLFYHCRMRSIYQQLALAYAEEQNRDRTMECIKKAKFHAEIFDSLPYEDLNYSGIFFGRAICPKGSICKTYSWKDVEMFYYFIRDKRFDFLREAGEFEAI